jgi:prevent-host-death family protein
MMSSNHKGAIAEIELAAAAIHLGIPVYKPLTDHARADLVFEVGERLWRVQCKWGRLSQSRDVVVVHVGGSWCSPNGYVRTTYTEQEVDLFGVHCGELRRSFLLPASLLVGMHQVHLRLTAPRNNQRACITLADDFDFEGAIAQLGERLTGSQEVVGSSPTSSTSPSVDPITIGANPFRDKLGYWMDRVAAGEEVLITRHGKPRIRMSPATA